MLSSSPQIRGTSYIDLGQNGIVNRLHHYGKDEQYSRVRTFSIENLDKFEEHNRQKKVTQEYEYLLKEIEQLDEDWDMETKSKKIT